MHLLSTQILIQPEDLSIHADDFQTRSFKVNPNAFMVTFDELTGTSKAVEENNFQKGVRDYFTAAGIELAGDNAPRLFFNVRTGTLMVQGTVAQLAAIENAVKALTTGPAQVAIEVRVMETTARVQNSGLRVLLTRLGTNDLDLPSALPLQAARRDESIRGCGTVVLSKGEFADLIRSSEQDEGVDLFMMPRTVTMSGRHVKMTMEANDTISDPPLNGSRRLRLNAE